MPSCSSSPARQVKQVAHDMTSHSSSSGLRLGGASDNAVSSFTQGAAPRFNTLATFKYRLISLARLFLFEPALEVHPFIADKLRAALFVASSASLQPLGFIVTFLQSLLCTLSMLVLICSHERLH
jgi:hypothetical protein